MDPDVIKIEGAASMVDGLLKDFSERAFDALSEEEWPETREALKRTLAAWEDFAYLASLPRPAS